MSKIWTYSGSVARAGKDLEDVLVIMNMERVKDGLKLNAAIVKGSIVLLFEVSKSVKELQRFRKLSMHTGISYAEATKIVHKEADGLYRKIKLSR